MSNSCFVRSNDWFINYPYLECWMNYYTIEFKAYAWGKDLKGGRTTIHINCIFVCSFCIHTHSRFKLRQSYCVPIKQHIQTATFFSIHDPFESFYLRVFMEHQPNNRFYLHCKNVVVKIHKRSKKVKGLQIVTGQNVTFNFA